MLFRPSARLAARAAPRASRGLAAARPSSFPLTKIVATVGPASEQLPMLTQVTAAGLNIMRINFSHATYEEADLRTNNLRQCPPYKDNNDNLRPVLLDTQGPEVRSGSFAGGVKEVEFVKGATVRLTTDPAMRTNQTADTLWVSYDKLPQTVKVGDSVLLDDGAMELKVERKTEQNEIICQVMNSHSLGSKKGVNFPGLIVDLPAMSDKDKEDLRWGIKNDIDIIAASFTRKPTDVLEMREFCAEVMAELHGPNHGRPLPLIVAKIENTEALDNFDKILEVTDGVMVARGDLGVEIPMETLTRWQKRIVRKCNLAGKPVVVATQMLESMIKAPRPTRAECTDVANACFDGADCVMLSGESAKGKYPTGSISIMQKLIKDAERGFIEEPEVFTHHIKNSDKPCVGRGIVEMANSSQAACVVVLDEAAATTVATHRPNVPIVTFVSSAKAGRMINIWRGIYPVIKSVSSPDAAVQIAHQQGFCRSGDNVVVVGGRPGHGLSVSVVKAA